METVTTSRLSVMLIVSKRKILNLRRRIVRRRMIVRRGMIVIESDDEHDEPEDNFLAHLVQESEQSVP